MKTKEQKVNQAFSFKAPNARSVLLAGDFTGWKKSALPLKSRGDGTWSIAVMLNPGTHHYRFLVDGEWRDDPECSAQVPNPFGTQDAVRVVIAAA